MRRLTGASGHVMLRDPPPATGLRPMHAVLGDILLHLFNHQTHHRGHAHACCSILTGTEPPSLDLIAFGRGVPAPDLAALAGA